MFCTESDLDCVKFSAKSFTNTRKTKKPHTCIGRFKSSKEDSKKSFLAWPLSCNAYTDKRNLLSKLTTTIMSMTSTKTKFQILFRTF